MKKLEVTFPLAELAARIDGTVVGDKALRISGLSALESPLPNHITFIRSSSGESVARALKELPAECAAIVGKRGSDAIHSQTFLASAILVQDPYRSFLDLIPLFFSHEPRTAGIHPSAVIDPSAHIAEGALIAPGCFVGAGACIGENATLFPNVYIDRDVKIGASVTLHAGVSIRNGVEIGDRVTIHNNAVIGADGFGFTPDAKLGLRKVPQLGNVQIGNDVEIGAGSCIDRGAFGPTIIGRGCKIDNLVQIGHNVVLGEFVIVCGQVGIAGSVKIGDGVVLGGQSGVADHLNLSKGVRVAGGAGVVGDLKEPGDYAGYPAIPAREWRRLQVSLRRLGTTSKRA